MKDNSDLDLSKRTSFIDKVADIGFSAILAFGVFVPIILLLDFFFGNPVHQYLSDAELPLVLGVVNFLYLTVKHDFMNPKFWHPEKPKWDAKAEVQKYLENH